MSIVLRITQKLSYFMDKEDNTILVIDDSDLNRESIVSLLRCSELNADGAPNGKEGYSIYKQKKYDTILLDMYMPVMSGIDFMKKYRQEIKVPIIAYTASDDQKILDDACSLGADMCLTAPFDPAVIVPNIQSMLRIYSRLFDKGDYNSKYIKVNFRDRTVEVSGEAVHLTHTEFKILAFLIENKNRFINRDDILREIWGSEYIMRYSYLHTHIHNIRRKLFTGAEKQEAIETHYNGGYKFNHIE